MEDVRQALYASKVVAYSQGFDQIAAAGEEYGWNIDRGAIVRIWCGGCIGRGRDRPRYPSGMIEEHLASHLGYRLGQAEDTYPGWRILNHESWLSETFTTLGTIGADRLTELTNGLMTDTSVEVKINRHVAEADVAIVVGPVSPTRRSGSPAGTSTSSPASRAR